MIRCENVRKHFAVGDRKVEVLKGLDMEILTPGFYGVMGSSGSGKSTLLHLLAALDSPDSGTLEVSGQRIENLSERELTLFRRREIGIVFQQFNLIGTLTARENIELPGLLAGESGVWLAERSGELLERLGLTPRAEHRPDALSGGEQQRIAIARALLFAPRVLFADEPTGSLDSRSSEALWTLLAEIASEQEMTILMVTHELNAAEHCEQVYVLNDGVIRGSIETDGHDTSSIAARYQQLVG